ncbi:MAG: phosphorylase [Acidilobus sp.]
MPFHIEASSIPERVLITGDPDRATLFANSLLRNAELLSRSRGFVVYRGDFNGVPVGIASHGIGGPSALIVLEELRMIGAKAFVRVGTAGSLSEAICVGDLVIVRGAGLTCGSGGLGLYMPYGQCPSPSPDPMLTVALYNKAKEFGLNPKIVLAFSSDSFYAEDAQTSAKALRSLGYDVVEMECGGLLSLANMRGLRGACALVVSNSVGKTSSRPSNETLKSPLIAAARAALEALTSIEL